MALNGTADGWKKKIFKEKEEYIWFLKVGGESSKKWNQSDYDEPQLKTSRDKQLKQSISISTL